MPSTIYVHLTWRVRDNATVIDKNAAAALEKLLPALARKHGVMLFEAGILQDHVHLLLLLPPVIDIPRLVQGLKGARSRILNRDHPRGTKPLRWASSYHLSSVSPRAHAKVAQYIREQHTRHPLSVP